MSKFDEIKTALQDTKRDGIDGLIAYLEASDFKFAPASTRYHCNFEGGLVEHTYNVWKGARTIAINTIAKAQAETNLDQFLIAAVCHDLSKIGLYKKGTRNRKVNGSWESYEVWEINTNPQANLLASPALPLGHAYASIEIAERFIKLTDIEKIMIANHMGPVGEGQNRIYEVQEAFRKCPEAVILHLADMQAAYLLEDTIES